MVSGTIVDQGPICSSGSDGSCTCASNRRLVTTSPNVECVCSENSIAKSRFASGILIVLNLIGLPGGRPWNYHHVTNLKFPGREQFDLLLGFNRMNDLFSSPQQTRFFAHRFLFGINLFLNSSRIG